MFFIIPDDDLKPKEFVIATHEIAYTRKLFIISGRKEVVKGINLGKGTEPFFFNENWKWNVKEILELSKPRREKLLKLLKESNFFVYDARKNFKHVYDYLTSEMKKRKQKIKKKENQFI
jgi:hypothetical protein